MDNITKQKVKDLYKNGKSWSDANDLFKSLSTKDLKLLKKNMQFMKDVFGLDMREDFFLSVIKGNLDGRDA